MHNRIIWRDWCYFTYITLLQKRFTFAIKSHYIHIYTQHACNWNISKISIIINNNKKYEKFASLFYTNVSPWVWFFAFGDQRFGSLHKAANLDRFKYDWWTWNMLKSELRLSSQTGNGGGEMANPKRCSRINFVCVCVHLRMLIFKRTRGESKGKCVCISVRKREWKIACMGEHLTQCRFDTVQIKMLRNICVNVKQIVSYICFLVFHSRQVCACLCEPG